MFFIKVKNHPPTATKCECCSLIPLYKTNKFTSSLYGTLNIAVELRSWFLLRTQTSLGIFGKGFRKKNTRTRGQPKVNPCLLTTGFGTDPESLFFKNWTQNRIRGSILLQPITGNALSYLFRTGTHPEVLVSSTVLMPTITVCRQITRFLLARECKEIAVSFFSLLCKFIVSWHWSSSHLRSIVYTCILLPSSLTEHGRAGQNSASRSNFVFLLEI
jgi:hypothetical protein